MTKLGNYICSQPTYAVSKTKSDRVGSYLHLVGRTDYVSKQPICSRNEKAQSAFSTIMSRAQQIN